MNIKIGNWSIKTTDAGIVIGFENETISAEVSFYRIETPLIDGKQLQTQINLSLTQKAKDEEDGT